MGTEFESEDNEEIGEDLIEAENDDADYVEDTGIEKGTIETDNENSGTTKKPPQSLVKLAPEPLSPSELRATIQQASKRVHVVMVLKYLVLNGDSSQNVNDIQRNLVDFFGPNAKMTRQSLSILLRKMAASGMLESATTKLHSGARYYEILADFPVEKVFQKYNRRISVKLLQFVPESGILESKLRESEEFQNACRQHFLTVDEGVSSLKENSNCVVENYSPSHGVIYSVPFLRRKGQ